MRNRQTKYMLSPGDIKKNALRRGVSPDYLRISRTVILTFNKGILDYLRESCGVHKRRFLNSELSPYCSASEFLEGRFEGKSVSVFVPPMGASPIAAFCEELICFGAGRIFLLCASWSLGKDYLRKGQIHLPNIAVGMDGTSFHYNNTDFMVEAEPETHGALKKALDNLDADWKEGGIGCCEAFYRITHGMVEDYRKQGCLSMDNGEVAVLYSLAKEKGVRVGVLLQPYIDLERGFDLSYLDKTYKETCRLQACAALQVIAES
jgi:uridine phosphorylase